jgi:uncharacterized protein YjiS (DUF1127 family)
MSTKHTHEGLETELPKITRHDLARLVKEGRRLRAEEIDKLFRSVGRGIIRLGSALAQPINAAISATGVPQRITLAWIWWREFRRVRAELGCYSERELMADLRLNRSEIPGIAAEAADERVMAFVRDHPDYRQTRRSRGRGAAGVVRAGG